jgi:hypothetical protein
MYIYKENYSDYCKRNRTESLLNIAKVFRTDTSIQKAKVPGICMYTVSPLVKTAPFQSFICTYASKSSSWALWICHHHRRRRLANMELGHLWTYSGPTRL